MKTYFLALKYKGTRYAGFQIQENAPTIQFEVQEAMRKYLRQEVGLTGSSRTDAGVHANLNFFHFDFEGHLGKDFLYHVNAILPRDIALTGIFEVPAGSHSRFDAISRRYRYRICSVKDPFMDDRSWYYPYPMDGEALAAAAAVLLGTHDFTSFAKRNAQVHTHMCTILVSHWEVKADGWEFEVEGNRFLRGMVRALVATMAKVGRGRIGVEEFRHILSAKQSALADFSAPGHGLFLDAVNYPEALGILP
jgi:tRNA pseudouridine38-40 synthase